MTIKKISHIAIVVPELAQALTFWVDVLGLQLQRIEHEEEQGVEAAFLPVGESEIELLQPFEQDSGVARYLEKRGPGMHHICFEVDDIEATLEQLADAGVALINTEAIMGNDGRKLAFVHPKDAGGVLIELYESPGEG